MPVTLSEGRARLLASVTPLTWRQVINLAYQATEEGVLIDLADWLTWGPQEEVAEWLWQRWVEHAAGDDPAWHDNLAGLGSRAAIGASPVTARSVGQRPPAGISSWREWRWRAESASLKRSTSAPSARECCDSEAG